MSVEDIFIGGIIIILERPLSNEYDPYFEKYINLVPSGDLIQCFIEQMDPFLTLVSNLSEMEVQYRYAQGKWSIKETVGHLCDAERMLSYLSFRIIRGDSISIPPINLGEFVIQGKYSRRDMTDIFHEWKAIRKSTIYLFKSLEKNDYEKKGLLKDHPITVLAIACILLGHTEHHINILHDCYQIY